MRANPSPNVSAYIHTYCILYRKINCSVVSLTCTRLSATSSFGQQLSVCAVSHVLEVWLAHIFSPGGFTGQGGCYSRWAHGWGRRAAGVQGPEQEVCLLLALEAHTFYYISVSSNSCWCWLALLFSLLGICRLLLFLCQDQCMQELVHMITTEPPAGVEEIKRFK